MLRRVATIGGLAAALAAGSARADEWAIVGPSAMGQGGAGVAAATGPGSVYWNPALPALGFDDVGVVSLSTFGLGLDFGLSVAAEGNVLKSGDAVFDFFQTNDFGSVQTRLNNGTATVADVQNAFKLINLIEQMDKKGEGLYLSSGASAELRLGWITVFGHDRVYAGADPVVDFSAGGSSSLTTGGIDALFNDDGGGAIAGPLTSTPVLNNAGLSGLRDAIAGAGFTVNQANAVVNQAETAVGATALSDPVLQQAVTSVSAVTSGAGTGSSLSNNQSGFDVKAIELREFGLGLSIPIEPKTLAVGVALKEVSGRTSWARVQVVSSNGQDTKQQVKDAIDQNTTETTRPSMDLGLAYSPTESVRLGLSAKDVFGMKFDLKNRPDDITIDPQVRLGAAWRPFDLLGFAADADVIKNKSDLLDGFESQMVGGGILFNPPILPFMLRGGLMKNMAGSGGEKLTYTGGLDIVIWKFKLGVAGAYAPSDVEIESNSSGSSTKIPQRVGVAADFGFSLEW